MDDLYVNLNRTICDADVLLNFCISNHLFIVPYNNTHHTFSFHFWINCFVSNQFLFLFYNHYSLSCLSMHDLIEVTVNICIIFLFDISAFETTFNLTLITFITLIALDDSSLYSSSFIDEWVPLRNLYLMYTCYLHTLLSFRIKKLSAPWLNKFICCIFWW